MLKIAAPLFLLILFAGEATAQDRCLEVAKLGRTKSKKIFTQKDFTNRVRNACSEAHRSRSGSGSSGFSLSIPGSDFGTGSSSSSSSSQYRKLCTEAGDVKNSDAAWEEYFEGLDASAHNLYETCKSVSDRLSIQIVEEAVHGKDLHFSISVAGDAASSSAKVIISGSSGVQCRNVTGRQEDPTAPSAKGARELALVFNRVHSKTISCVRDSKEKRASIIVNRTDLPSTQLTIPWAADPEFHAAKDLLREIEKGIEGRLAKRIADLEAKVRNQKDVQIVNVRPRDCTLSGDNWVVTCKFDLPSPGRDRRIVGAFLSSIWGGHMHHATKAQYFDGSRIVARFDRMATRSNNDTFALSGGARDPRSGTFKATLVTEAR